LKKAPSEYLKQLYFDTLVFTNEGLRHLIAEVGISQIMLGTDGPGGWDREAVDFVLKAPGLSDSDRRAILARDGCKIVAPESTGPGGCLRAYSDRVREFALT